MYRTLGLFTHAIVAKDLTMVLYILGRRRFQNPGGRRPGLDGGTRTL